MKKFLFLVTAVLAVASCTKVAEPTLSGLDPNAFKDKYEGKKVALYTLKNEQGMEVCITNFGGRIVSMMVPDINGDFLDVVLGFDNIQDYYPENNASDFGAAIGRYANRIKQGQFTLDGETYQLPRNNFGHCLHGGPKGWQYKVYKVVKHNDTMLKLLMDSPDGDSGFPGRVKAYVTYTLLPENALKIEYEATTDKPTIINMTNHSYFNLAGDPEYHRVSEDFMRLNAITYTPVDATFIPTGDILNVSQTPMDFSSGEYIGKDIDNFAFEQIKNGNGFDHNWILNTHRDINEPAVRVYSAQSCILLTVYTDEPGIQIYTGNFLDGSVQGKKGVYYKKRSGICLETQKYPDSPNHPDWPSPVLRPGETYRSNTIFAFSTLDINGEGNEENNQEQ